MRVVVAQSAAEMETLRDAWQAMACAPSATIFQRYDWNLLAARVLGESPHVVFAESSSGAALIPACVCGDSLALLGGELFDYRDVLHRGDDAALRSAWDEVARLRLPLRFRALRGERPDWAPLRPRPFCGAPMIRRTDVSAEQFAVSHPRLRRALRRLSAAGVEFGRGDGGAQTLLRAIWQQKAAQFGGVRGNAFADARAVEFLLAVAQVAPCDVFYLAAGTHLVSALVAFRDGGVRRFYTTWFDPAWAELSPGMAIVFEAARLSLVEGFDVDLMTGEQPYKKRLATHAVPLFEVDAAAERVAAIGRAPVEMAA